MYHLIIISSIFILLQSCATTSPPAFDENLLKNEILLQEQQQITNQLRFQKKLDILSYPLIKAAVPFCTNNTTYNLGLQVLNQHSFGEDYKQAVNSQLKLTDNLTVQWVIKKSPSDHLGIKKGDIVVSINGTKIDKGENAFESYQQLLKQAYLNQQDIKLILSRDKKTKEYAIKADVSCDYPVVAKLSGSLNASASGSSVLINSNLLNTLDDNSVSFIIAHEIAHNTQNHVNKTYIRFGVAGLIGSLISPSIGLTALGGFIDGILISFYVGSEPLEKEADYVGLYIIANADIALNKVDNIWRNYSRAVGDFTKSSFISTHPTFPYRHLAMQQTIEEIKTKKQKGLALLPNY